MVTVGLAPSAPTAEMCLFPRVPRASLIRRVYPSLRSPACNSSRLMPHDSRLLDDPAVADQHARLPRTRCEPMSTAPHHTARPRCTANTVTTNTPRLASPHRARCFESPRKRDQHNQIEGFVCPANRFPARRMITITPRNTRRFGGLQQYWSSIHRTYVCGCAARRSWSTDGCSTC